MTFEYILLDDVNDSLAHARQLAHYMRGLNAYVNLIPYNSVDEHGFKPSSHVEEFKDELLRLHINCTVRKRTWERYRWSMWSAKSKNVVG